MSWASLLKKEPVAAVTLDGPSSDEAKSKRVAIVDANAIISGLQLSSIADRFITIEEVLAEVKDKQSRAFMAALPFKLEIMEPSDESVQAVTAFARATGDLHALSRTDLRLLALAHSTEVSIYGASHLRSQPVQAAIRSKRHFQGKGLPGWGTVPNPEDWAAIDALPDSAGQGKSRVRSVAQALDATDSNAQAPVTPAPDAEPAPAAAAPSPLAFPSLGDAAAADLSAQGTGPAADWFKPTQTAELAAAPSPPAGALAPIDGTDHFLGQASTVITPSVDPSLLGDDDDEEDEDEWSTAGKSRAAERRRKRNQARWEARQAAKQHDAASVASSVIQAVQPVGSKVVASATQQQQSNGSGVSATNGSEQQPGSQHQDDEEDDEEDEEEEEEGSEEDEGEVSQEGEGEGEGETEEVEERVEMDASATDCGEVKLNTTSSVSCVTADFAMQNVLLQMGLRLVTRDGRQINRLSRWALRCSACFFVTKEAGRLFCPRCGNMTIERVEVTVGADGAEFYGVRKKHVLKGTRFALPKPKGGRARNPILREDEFMQKMRPRRKKPAAAEELDPFAPEFSQDTWHSTHNANQAALASHKGAAYLLAGWKNNPNQRKAVANNRRRK